MTEESKAGDLELDQDIRFQRRSWRAERIGWAVLGLIVVLALLGFIGEGPLGRREVASPGGEVRAEYHRFLRFQSPARMNFTLTPHDAASTATLRLARNFVHHIRLQSVVPEPARSVDAADGLLMEFHTTPGSEPVNITLDFTPEKIGGISGQAVSGEAMIDLKLYVLP